MIANINHANLLQRLMNSQNNLQVKEILKEPTLDYSKKADALNSCMLDVLKKIRRELSVSENEDINFKAIMAMTYFSQ